MGDTFMKQYNEIIKIIAERQVAARESGIIDIWKDIDFWLIREIYDVPTADLLADINREREELNG